MVLGAPCTFREEMLITSPRFHSTKRGCFLFLERVVQSARLTADSGRCANPAILWANGPMFSSATPLTESNVRMACTKLINDRSFFKLKREKQEEEEERKEGRKEGRRRRRGMKKRGGRTQRLPLI